MKDMELREYWLVNYQERVVEVYLLDDNNVYSKPAVYLEKMWFL